MEARVRETLTRLLIDQSEGLQRLVENAERLLRIDNATGEMVLAVPRLHISDRDFIGLLLLSKFFAHRLGLAKKETMTFTEIVERSGLDEKIVSSRLIELRNRSIVESTQNGEFTMSYPKAEYFLEEARQNMLVERNRSEFPVDVLTNTVAPEDVTVEYLRRLRDQKSMILLAARRIV